ncbi:hypothetical protein PV332_21545 [Streptomyces scabiei]|nr:hypothetical protein [Streptomyces scabiei]MDX2578043.1 hypothetical protein [Streptomyces scabiei]
MHKQQAWESRLEHLKNAAEAIEAFGYTVTITITENTTETEDESNE